MTREEMIEYGAMAIRRAFIEPRERRNWDEQQWERDWIERCKPPLKEAYRREAEACLVAAGAIKGRRLSA